MHQAAYRPDIDGLRAIAVLSVVVYHAFPTSLKSGFIGVDIFFVISGYLISLTLFEQIERGTFSFRDFYSRRIRRIFPALITVLVSCLIFGWFWLLSDEYMNLGRHVAAGAAFVSNFVLWNESGYFDTSSVTKPLLHLWSLGIEEQFYIFWPLLLWAAWKIKLRLLWLTIGIGLASFAWSVGSVADDAIAAFYSPLTRAWELLCGSLLAWWSIHTKQRVTAVLSGSANEKTKSLAINQFLAVAGLILLATGFAFIRESMLFPGYWALLPVSGAVCLIAAGPNAWLNRYLLSHPIAVWFGLISYPLYLWHWPLLSLAQTIAVKGLSTIQLLGIIATSVVLAWLTYVIIERPLRFKSARFLTVSMLSLGIAVTGAAGYFVMKQNGLPDRALLSGINLSNHLQVLRPNFGLARQCLPDFSFDSELCSYGNSPDLYLWGDSYAMHLADALRATGPELGFRQQSLTACPPVLNLAPLSLPRYPESWGVKCIAHNKNVLKWLSNRKDFQYVILASPFRLGEQILVDDVVVKSNRDVYLAHLRKTINHLRSLGFKPVIIAPPPAPGYDLGRCWARMSIIKQEAYCDFQYKDVPKADFETDEIMKSAGEFAPIVFLKDLICPDGLCGTTINGIPVYRDIGHLSIEGSRALGEKFHLSRVVREQADRYWSAAR
jgi:peptidoglycan/LPS O-acetylase OafA/YrhL